MNTDCVKDVIWWGNKILQPNGCSSLKIGPLLLQVSRYSQEWQISYEYDLDKVEDTNGWEYSANAKPNGALEKSARYVFQRTNDKFIIQPLLADRPVVSRPVTPIHLPVGEQITLYLSSPLWLTIKVGEPSTQLFEIPIHRPSDTWFGPSTVEGELCYASRTHGLLNLEELPQRSHRAITPVLIINQADSELLLERVSLPVPYLSLFGGINGSLWSEAITLVREEGGDMASLKIDKGPPTPVENSVLVCNPRKSSEKNSFYRALNTMFG